MTATQPDLALYRCAAGKDDDVLCRLPIGLVVTIIHVDKTTGWYLVFACGHTGWMNPSDLEISL